MPIKTKTIWVCICIHISLWLRADLIQEVLRIRCILDKRLNGFKKRQGSISELCQAGEKGSSTCNSWCDKLNPCPYMPSWYIIIFCTDFFFPFFVFLEVGGVQYFDRQMKKLFVCLVFCVFLFWRPVLCLTSLREGVLPLCVQGARGPFRDVTGPLPDPELVQILDKE